MSNQTTTVTRKDKYAHTKNMSVLVSNWQPSWKRPIPDLMKGTANINIELGDYTSGTMLNIDAAEWCWTDMDRTRISEKRVMVSMDEDAARVLYQMLKERFEK